MILITGGARSGKSRFAESLAAEQHRVRYIATARPSRDEEMQRRIARHQASRPDHWETVEEDRDLARYAPGTKAILLDCVTVMISNYLFDGASEDPSPEEASAVERRAKEELEALIEASAREGTALYLVTNELGSGLVPMHPLSRTFRDIQGRVNQFLAARAESVYLCVSGIPVKIK